MKKLVRLCIGSIVVIVLSFVLCIIDQSVVSFSPAQNKLKQSLEVCEKKADSLKLVAQQIEGEYNANSDLYYAGGGFITYRKNQKIIEDKSDKLANDLHSLNIEYSALIDKEAEHNHLVTTIFEIIITLSSLVFLYCLILIINTKIGDWGATKEIGRKNSQIVFWLTGVIGIVIIVLSKDLNPKN